MRKINFLAAQRIVLLAGLCGSALAMGAESHSHGGTGASGTATSASEPGSKDAPGPPKQSHHRAEAEASDGTANKSPESHNSARKALKNASNAAPSSPDSPPFDLRVLIDVSGSMKLTDPDNLRVPALKLLTELLPPEGRAGIWSFGQSTETLVPLGRTDKGWKAKSLSAVNRLHSKDPFTNIEKALTTGTADWTTPGAEGTARQVILLTDGKVDIDKDPEVSKASQARLINELLPRLKALGVKLHTVALSDAADQSLLQQLAVGSDGSFEMAATAERLHRTFLHMFEHTAPRDSIPLAHNRFQVDASIDELTLLVFRKKPDATTLITLPDGKEIDANSKLDGLRWHREAQYDLATFSKPLAGEWRINGTTDPDNRAMVVTNLKLKIKEQPNNIVVGEQLKLMAKLVTGDEPITEHKLLDLVKVQGVQMGEDKIKNTFAFKGPNESGEFNATIGEELRDGKNEVVVAVKSPTFERERRFQVEVHEHPVDVTAKPFTDGKGHNGYAVQFIPKPGLIDLEGAELTVTVVDEQGRPHPVEVQPPTAEGWNLLMQKLDGRKIVLKGKITTMSLRGQKLEFETVPLTLGESGGAEPVKEAVTEHPNEKPVAPNESTNNPNVSTVAKEESPGNSGWTLTAVIVIGVNLVLGAGALFGFKWFKRRRAAALMANIGI